MISRSRYTAHVVDGVIQLEDLEGPISVTNDAERVITDLAERGFDLALPVIYRDTEGRWDQLQVTSGLFSGFGMLGARTPEAARAMVRARR